MSPKRSVVGARLSDQRGRFLRTVVLHFIGLRRAIALGIGVSVLSVISFQPMTPAEAAALWIRSQHAQVAHSSKSPSKPGSDPAYEPPPKHGSNYVAPAAQAGSSKGSLGPEELNLRTRNSRTFSSGGRQMTTFVYPESVNYRDSSGQWQPIDDSLVKTALASYAYQNAANRYTIYLPADIASQPIRVELGSSWVTLAIAGARGAATISGSNATYAGVLPGVSVVVTAQPDSVEEGLILQGPSSQMSFTYRVQTSPGLKVKKAGTTLQIVDAAGRLAFSFAAPEMYDGSKSARGRSSLMTLDATQDSKGTTVTLSPDRKWLGDAARRWPVTIDPTFIVGDLQDCYISAGSPTTSFCGGTSLNAGFDGTNASRALLQFNLSAVPSTNTVVSAKLLMYLGSASTSTATSLAVYQLTRAWTTGATWNTYNGTNAWTTAGGDFNGTAAATTNGIAATGTWYSWSPTSLVQGWVNGSIANDGLIVKEPTENMTNVLSFNSATASNPPYLEVVHQPGGSAPSSYSSTVLADSPVAYWHLDETSGSTMTDAQHNDNGTYQGGYTLGQSSLIQPAAGYSVSFNGSSGYATASTLTALQGGNTRSVELWFKTSYDSGQPLFDSGDSGGNLYQMFNLQLTGPGTVCCSPPSPNTSGLYLGDWGEDVYLPGLYLADGKRHHMVVVMSGTSLWIYVDNTLPKGFISGSGWPTRYPVAQPFSLPNALNSAAQPILIGNTRHSDGGASTYFQGQMDEVAVYSTALSATQVQQHWQAGNGLPWTPTSVSATAGQNQATLSWTAPTFNGSGITGYTITPQVGNTVRTPIIFNSTATSETVTNLSGGTAYTFSVTAFNSLGLGVPSSLTSSVTPSGPALPLYEDTVLGDSPIEFWPLGDTNSSVAGDLTQTSDERYYGPVTEGDVGPVINYPNKAANFSGSNAYVRFNHSALLEPAAVSIEMWIKPASVPGSDVTLVTSPQPGNSEWSSSYGYSTWIEGNNGKFHFGTTTANIATGSGLPTGVWSYLVGTSDGTTVRLYVNGKQQVAVSAGATNYGGSPNFDLLLTRFGYAGDIADFAVYGTALAASQISNHYAASGYTPGPVSGLVATPSTNSASLNWNPPSYTGTSPISSYTVTPIVDSKSGTPVTIGGSGTGANIPNLPGGASYSFQVRANNASGASVAVTSGAVTIGSPAAGPGSFGTYLYLRGGQGDGQAYSHYGFVSRNSVPALSTWTLEARLWGFTSMSTTGSHMAFGSLSGTTSNPTDQSPLAGLNFNIGGSPLQTYMVWPGGGSCAMQSDPGGMASAFNSQVTTPVHVALSYDGTTVRGFINGSQVCSQASSSASLPAAPFGFMDNTGLTQGYFDEIRVSNVARWTTNFTPSSQQYTTDGNTLILWHFDDYPISKLPSIHIQSNMTDGTGYPVNIIPSTYRDSSGNINHANTIWASGQSSGPGDDWRRPYSLGQGVTADELTGGGSNWLCPCTINSTARPVNDSTGEFWHSFSDFHVVGRMNLDFTRTYSSLRTNLLGPTGYGWTENYNQYLSFDGSGNATVHEANGSAVAFTFTSPSTYTGPPDEHVTLVKNGDSTFTLTDVGGNQAVFNAPVSNSSSLAKLVDRHGTAAYTLTMAYNGDGTLASVTDPNSRTLSFSYQTIGSSKLIQTITQNDSPSRSISFQYGTNSSDPTTYLSLTQVTDVGSGVTKFTYDSNHYLLTMTDPNSGVTTNVYDSSTHMVTSQTDPLNRKTTFSYSGGITTVTDPKGNVTQEEYLNGMLLSRTIGYGTAQAATWTYAFDPAAVGLTASVGPNGETVTTVRDSNANVLSETDELGRTTTYTYNSFGEPLTIQDPTGVTTTNTYSSTGDLATASRPLVGTGQTKTTTYNHGDSNHPGDVTSMVDADNNTWTYGYDGNANRTSVKDPLGNLATYVYNSDSWMTSSVAPNGNTSRQDTFSRTAVNGSWGTATDGNAWTLQAGSATFSTTGTQGEIASSSSDSFESLGPALPITGGEDLVRWQVGASTDTAGAVLRVSPSASSYYGVRYDGAGHVELFGEWGGTVYTNIGGVRVSYTPGTAKQWFRFRVQGSTLYFKVWADGNAEPSSWTGQTTDTNVAGPGFVGLYGNASSGSSGVLFDQFSGSALPSDATTNYTYNSFGQRTELTDPLGHSTIWHYDPNQNLDKITDADGNVTTNVYDADNELTQVKRADTPQTTLTTDYNADGTVLDQKDGKGNAIQTYAYDSLAHVSTVTDALSNVTTYVYDAFGNLVSKQDPGGNCSTTPATSCTAYMYDAANQLTAIAYSDGVTPNVSNITYDGNGQRLSMTDGTGTSSWGWDSLHRMVSYQNGNGAQVQWQYNLRNLATTITYPGLLNVTRGYDAAGRWTSVQDWNSNTTTFGYDPNSNLTSETFPSGSGVVDSFTFNAADQMTAVSSAKGGTILFSAGYSRDANNQLSSDSSATSGTGSYKYTPLNQVCYAGSSNTAACSSPPSGSIAYAFDAADNLTQKGSTQQAFKNADELCWTASTSSACSTPPSGATTYQYDTRGNRTGVTPSGGQAQTLTYDQANRLVKYSTASTTGYGYNGDGLRMCKFAGSSNQPCQATGKTAYLWDVAGSLPLLLKDGSTAYVYGPGGLPLEQINTPTTCWYHHDQIGSTRLVTNSSGGTAATYTFDPYGGLAFSTNPGGITNPFGFIGQFEDSESTLYYLRARYYDPGTAQFGSQDPKLSVTRDPYGYVSGDPLDKIDPRGLYAIGGCGGLSMAVGLRIAFQVCGVVVFNTQTHHLSGGFIATSPVYGGDSFFGGDVPQEIGTPSIGLSFTLYQSNAQHLSQLSGPFVTGGASGGPLAEEAGVNPKGSCPRIGFDEVGYSIGPLPEVHAGISTTTIVHQFGSDG